MTNPDRPFKLRGGHTQQTSVYNRISAIQRIRHLTGVDLTKKDKYYLYTLDVEMYQKWYKDYPKDHRIDEEWCQRAAQVVKSMEDDGKIFTEETGVEEKVKEAYNSHESLPLKEPEPTKPKLTWAKALIARLKEGFR